MHQDRDKIQRNGWPINLSRLNQPPLWLSSSLISLATILGLFLLLVSTVALWRLAIDILGADPTRESEAVKSLLPIAAAAIGLPLIIWRLAILNRQTATAEAKTQIDRETHFTSIFARAIDQLGTNRDLKVSERSKDGDLKQIERTVPNIEVRLGGIHSLSRLAEESARDALKINSTLFSYVRENSWSDRAGGDIARPTIKRAPDPEWLKDHDKKKSGEVTASYEKWAASIFDLYSSNVKWSHSVYETRVDVKEAVEAIGAMERDTEKSLPIVFYECLFADLLLKSQLLQHVTFERCTFVRCQFEAKNIGQARFEKSLMIDCAISAVNSKLEFRECVLDDCGFAIPSSTLSLRWCDLVSASFRELKDCTISVLHSSSYLGWYGVGNRLNINARYSTFAEVNFDRNVFSNLSTFVNCNLMKLDLQETDFELAQFEDTNLDYIGATPSTKHPSALPRPHTWPQFFAQQA